MWAFPTISKNDYNSTMLAKADLPNLIFPGSFYTPNPSKITPKPEFGKNISNPQRVDDISKKSSIKREDAGLPIWLSPNQSGKIFIPETRVRFP